jgi:HEAT repeat protein
MPTQKTHFLLTCLLVPLLCFLVLSGCGKPEKSTDELIVDLQSRQEKERMIAVRTLKVRTEEAAQVVPALMAALKDKHSDIRLSAAIKLGMFGEYAKDAVPALQEALNDRDVRVREAASIALPRIDPNITPKPSPTRTGSK